MPTTLRTSLVLTALLLGACRAAGPAFSPAADRDISRLRSQSLRLLERAEESFEAHAGAVAKLRLEIVAARDRAARREGNEVSVAQWDLLLDPQANLVGGFLQRWETEERLSAGFITQALEQVRLAFDHMDATETAKSGGPS